MQVFPRETTDYISEQFLLYFRRKKMSIREAKAIIDYVQGSPTPLPSESGAVDYSRTRVQGGHDKRPSAEYIGRIVEKLEHRARWDEVFEELLIRCEQEPEAERIIDLFFNKRLKENEICNELHIDRATYYDYKNVLLCRAAVLAIVEGLIEY